MVELLPLDSRRILVAGTAGSGKTTLAAQLARACGYLHTEIDALFHGPGWQRRPEFQADVDALSMQESWVTEWQYSEVRPLLAERADTLIWLDYPRWLVMWRVTLRTARRTFLKEELWNGNREPGLIHALLNREGIIRWAWDTHARNRVMIGELRSTHPHLRIIRLRGARATRRWLSSSAVTRAGSQALSCSGDTGTSSQSEAGTEPEADRPDGSGRERPQAP